LQADVSSFAFQAAVSAAAFDYSSFFRSARKISKEKNNESV
jgi:hypothetical protein